MPWRESIYPYLTQPLQDCLRMLSAQEAAAVSELRVYAGRPAEWVMSDACVQTPVSMDAHGMDGLLAALSGYALYSCEQAMAEGYIPLPGGHRAGICGRMRWKDGTWHMADVTSVCLRIARHVPGASGDVRAHLLDAHGRARRVLLMGPPGCGKTTVLRDAALWLSDSAGMHVAAADEREELFAMLPPQCGRHVDVLAGVPKARAFTMLLRAMAPQVIVTDEIGRREDVQALLDAARCGVGVLASAHADGLDDLLGRPALRRLLDARAFERYLHLGRRGCVLHVFDGTGHIWNGEEAEQHGKLGCGGHGDDRDHGGRLLAL